MVIHIRFHTGLSVKFFTHHHFGLGSNCVASVQQNRTAFKLCAALRKAQPPIFITDGVAKQWIIKFGSETKTIMSAAALEILPINGDITGNLIRIHMGHQQLESSAVVARWNIMEVVYIAT